jgi:hypothetical protein
LSAINCTPGPESSNLIKTEKAVPTKPENSAKIKYRVPMSFAFEDRNHLSFHKLIVVKFIAKRALLLSDCLQVSSTFNITLQITLKSIKQKVNCNAQRFTF